MSKTKTEITKDTALEFLKSYFKKKGEKGNYSVTHRVDSVARLPGMSYWSLNIYCFPSTSQKHSWKGYYGFHVYDSGEVQMVVHYAMNPCRLQK